MLTLKLQYNSVHHPSSIIVDQIKSSPIRRTAFLFPIVVSISCSRFVVSNQGRGHYLYVADKAGRKGS